MPHLQLSLPGGYAVHCDTDRDDLAAAWIDAWLPTLRPAGRPLLPLIGVRGPVQRADGTWDWPRDVRVFSELLSVPPGIDGTEILRRLRARHEAAATWWAEHDDGRRRDMPWKLRCLLLEALP